VTPYVNEIAPRPGALACTAVYRRLVPGTRLVGHVVTEIYPEDHGRPYIGWPESSEVGKVSGATWECRCGAKSRNIWSRARWARRALIDHWRRMHSDKAIERRGAC
jgi:hypothetical protein